MQETPFELLSCSWPRPVVERDGRWASEPEWDAPLMPSPPEPRWRLIEGEPCWAFDWRELFRTGLGLWDAEQSGEMRGFHVVFRIRVRRGGTLLFWDDDGCVIRRAGVVVHRDPTAHGPARHEIEVAPGDVLEVAQWQHTGWWLWGARAAGGDGAVASPHAALSPYLDAVRRRLRDPEGPPLKMYTNGAHPARAIVCIYSLILNGYAPSKVLLYGDYQWSPRARELFAALLPFAEVVPAESVRARLLSAGGQRLVQSAMNYWYVMKTFVALLLPPAEFCLMDDDLFVLEEMGDALDAFRERDLVYTPDTDHTDGYLRTWGFINGRKRGPLPTANFNAGLYLMRHDLDARAVAAQTLRVRPNSVPPHYWEQGYIAALFAGKRTLSLPTQRYFFPLFDGLPGGTLGYDYALNPCGFASVHFGGLSEKPTDAVTLHLLPQLLGRAAVRAARARTPEHAAARPAPRVFV